MTPNFCDGRNDVVGSQVTDEEPEAVGAIAVTEVVLDVTVASVPTVLNKIRPVLNELQDCSNSRPRFTNFENTSSVHVTSFVFYVT